MKARFCRCLFALALLFTLGVSALYADDYLRLWRAVEAAEQSDKPRTALAQVDAIYRCARQEGNEAQQLRAQLTSVRLMAQLSPDSLRAALARADAAQPAAGCAPLWQYTLGCLRAACAAGDTTLRGEAARLVRNALTAEGVEQLAGIESAAFAPLLTDDVMQQAALTRNLLGIVVRGAVHSGLLSAQAQREALALAAACFTRRGDRAAALLLRIDSLRQESAHTSDYLALARANPALPEVIEAYIAAAQQDGEAAQRVAAAQEGLKLYASAPRAAVLRNILMQMQRPAATMTWGDLSDKLPGDTIRLPYAVRNLPRAELRLTRLTVTARELDAARRQSAQYEALLKRVAGAQRCYTLAVKGALPAYAYTRDTLALALPAEPGVYLAALYGGGKCLAREALCLSSLRVLQTARSGRRTRVLALNGRSGAALPRAQLIKVDEAGRQVQAWRLNEAGAWLTGDAREWSYRYYVTADGDAAHPAFTLSTEGDFVPVSALRDVRTEVFTDRAVYRPGQRVQFAAVHYAASGDSLATMPDAVLSFSLVDHKGVACDSVTLRTDAFGAVGGALQLPADCEPGSYRVSLNKGLRGSAWIQVEAYRRAPFTVRAEIPATGYAAGDTLRLAGVVKTYTGLPVGDAVVSWQCSAVRYLRKGVQGDESPIAGECFTDSTGAFTIALPLPAEPRGKAYGVMGQWLLSYSAVAPSGESVEGENLVIPLAKKRYTLSCDLPDLCAREKMPAVRVRLTNAAGKEVAARGALTLTRGGRIVGQAPFAAGDSLPRALFTTLPSGRYAVQLRVEADEVVCDTFPLRLFSLSDTRLPADFGDAPVLWQRSSAAGDTLYVAAGARQATLHSDLLCGDSLLHSARITLADTLVHLALRYVPNAASAPLRACLSLVGGWRAQTLTGDVSAPPRDRRLVLHWTRLRTHLAPGESDRWTLRVTYPDGTPARASVMARLYDRSLDAFGENAWALAAMQPLRPYTPGYASLRGMWRYTGLDGMLAVRTEREPARRFADFRAELWQIYLGARRGRYAPTYLSAARRGGEVMEATNAKMMSTAERTVADEAQQGAGTAEAFAGNAPSALRRDFSETAFFFATLQTDSVGEVALPFRLPESLTAWRCTAVAHTRDMRHGATEAVVVARRPFMVHASVPRFVVRGDEVSIPVTIQTDSLHSARTSYKVAFTVADAHSGAQLHSETREVNGGKCAFRYAVRCATDSIRLGVSASQGELTDGEVYTLAVQSDSLVTTRTLPFVLKEAGTQRIPLNALVDRDAQRVRLTLRAAAHPRAYVEEALTAVGKTRAESATQWAERLYANGFGQVLLRDDSAAETRTLDYYGALHRLRALQTPAGGWAWYKEMPASVAVTADIAMLLSRLEALGKNAEVGALLTPALRFLATEAEREASLLRKDKHRMPADAMLRFLYVLTQRGERLAAAPKEILLRFVERQRETTLWQKALLATIQHRAGQGAQATEQLSGLVEHAVTDTLGLRYFDSYRALSLPRSYRLTTQAATLEAQRLIAPRDTATRDAFAGWLLLSKRAQQWDTSRATTDAAYALWGEGASRTVLGESAAGSASDLLFSLEAGGKLLAATAPAAVKEQDGAGVTQQTYAIDAGMQMRDALTLVAHKRTPGIAWGSVVAEYPQAARQAQASGSGMTLSRVAQVWRKGEWRALSGRTELTQGDRVRYVVTLRTETDYDFVRIALARPACYEPRTTSSGVAFVGTATCYRAVGDSATTLYVEKLPKGVHTFAEEFRVDRAGRYLALPATAQCVYAPEFCATTGSEQVETQ